MNLFDLFATINLDSSNYEQGINEAEKSSDNFGTKLKNGLSSASKVAVKAISAVTVAGTALSGTMIKGASNLAAYGDEIDKESQKLGISAEAYQEWDAIMQHAGGSVSNLKPALKTLSKEITNNSDAFQQLGLSQEEIVKMPIEDVLSATITKLQEMEPGIDRTRLATQLLGRSSVELGALLNTSAEETEAMRQRVHELGGVLSNDAVKSAAGFQDSLQDMQTAFAGVKNGILSDMLPGLTSLIDGFASLITGEEGAELAIQEGMDNLVGGITDGVGKAVEIGQTLLPAIISAIVDNLPAIAESGVQLIETILMAIVENLPQIIAAGLDILQSLATSLIDNLPTLIDAVIQSVDTIAKLLTDPDTLSMLLESLLTIVLTIANSLIENLPTLIDTFMTILDNIITFVLDNLPMFINAAVEIIISLMNGLIKSLPTLLAYLPTIITSIVNGLLGMLPELVQAGVTLLTALVDNLPIIITTICDKLPEIIDSMVDALLDMIPDIVDAGFTLLTALIDNLPEIILTIVGEIPRIVNRIIDKLTDMIPDIVMMGFDLLVALLDNLPEIIVELVSKLPQIISAIVGGLLEGVGNLWDVGKALIEGLWNGILSVGDWIKEKIGGFFSGIWGGVKSFFGIASPSKKFAWVGEMLDKGLVKGIEDYADLAVDAAEDMAEDVVGAASPDMDFTVGASGLTGSGGLGLGGSVINVYGAEGQDVNELAEIISQRMALSYSQEKVVWA